MDLMVIMGMELVLMETIILNYIFFDIKGIKIMASDVINYKYHIKSMSLW